MVAEVGSLGPDLAAVYTRGMDHTWTLTLRGVTYDYDHVYDTWVDPQGNIGYGEAYITRAHATSFTLEFFGPDGATLNQVVSGQLAGGGLTNGAVAELLNFDYFYPDDPWASVSGLDMDLQLVPQSPDDGVAFGLYAPYIADFTPAYPEFTSQQIWAEQVTIADNRSPYSGEIQAYGQLVNIGSTTAPPVVPFLTILDGAIAEGNKGTTRLDLSVCLSGVSSETVTVQYRTVDGSATARNDYTATSGTLTLQPGQTSGTISLAIKTDRKRERDESFTVQLSYPSGAWIRNSTATATILNDD